MVEDQQGRLQLKYRMKKSVPQAIGEAYHLASQVSLTDDESDEPVATDENDFVRTSLWRERNNAYSLGNERGCDEIM